MRNISPPIIARKIRLVPYSSYQRTVCMRVELYGCTWRGVCSMQMTYLEHFLFQSFSSSLFFQLDCNRKPVVSIFHRTWLDYRKCFLPPMKWHANVFSHTDLCVCLFVMLQLSEMSSLVCIYVFSVVRSGSHIKIIGSR